MFETA